MYIYMLWFAVPISVNVVRRPGVIHDKKKESSVITLTTASLCPSFQPDGPLFRFDYDDPLLLGAMTSLNVSSKCIFPRISPAAVWDTTKAVFLMFERLKVTLYISQVRGAYVGASQALIAVLAATIPKHIVWFPRARIIPNLLGIAISAIGWRIIGRGSR